MTIFGPSDDDFVPEKEEMSLQQKFDALTKQHEKLVEELDNIKIVARLKICETGEWWKCADIPHPRCYNTYRVFEECIVVSSEIIQKLGFQMGVVEPRQYWQTDLEVYCNNNSSVQWYPKIQNGTGRHMERKIIGITLFRQLNV